MKTWYKLGPEETRRIYCIPAEIASDPNNHFWGLTYHPKEFLEGRRPLVVISTNAEDPSAITLQIRTLNMEVLHEPGPNGEVEIPNPLEWVGVGGYLSLPVEQLYGLCTLLKEQKHLFANAEAISNKQPGFRLLHAEEIYIYRLHPEWFLGVQQTYYIHVVQPVMPDIKNTVSLVTIDSEMSVSIMTFAKDDLLDKSFTPLRRSVPKLYLNWSGLLEFADILSQAVKRAS